MLQNILWLVLVAPDHIVGHCAGDSIYLLCSTIVFQRMDILSNRPDIPMKNSLNLTLVVDELKKIYFTSGRGAMLDSFD